MGLAKETASPAVDVAAADALHALHMQRLQAETVPRWLATADDGGRLTSSLAHIRRPTFSSPPALWGLALYLACIQMIDSLETTNEQETTSSGVYSNKTTPF